MLNIPTYGKKVFRPLLLDVLVHSVEHKRHFLPTRNLKLNFIRRSKKFQQKLKFPPVEIEITTLIITGLEV